MLRGEDVLFPATNSLHEWKQARSTMKIPAAGSSSYLQWHKPPSTCSKLNVEAAIFERLFSDWG
ncbi:hypothetical protein ACS0TY_021130 [Phlomoides rotata]